MADLQENDQHFMNKLQEIVPQLRKEIQVSVRNRLSMQLQKAKEKKRLEIAEKYQEKIKMQIDSSNQKLRTELTGMMERIERIKRDLNNQRLKRLSQDEEEELIQQTVEQVLGDQIMLQEVKERLRPKAESRVRLELEKELEENLQIMKKDMIQQINEEREDWTKQRIDFWNRQSELELSQLAAQHSELSTKRQNMETVFNGKKMEKRQAQKRWEEVIQKNTKISNLRAQLKQLKELR